VLLNKGKGSFQPAPVFPTGAQPESVAIADFNRDGHLDIVTANFASGINVRPVRKRRRNVSAASGLFGRD
jgi:hypothetical protein